MNKKFLKILIGLTFSLLVLVGGVLFFNKKNYQNYSLKNQNYSDYVRINPLIGEVESFSEKNRTIKVYDVESKEEKTVYITDNAIFYRKKIFSKGQYSPTDEKIWEYLHIGDKVFANTYRPTVIYILDK